MIKGLHAMFYSPKAEELRTFIRDKLGFAHTDVGEGWLIFTPPAVELGCHPADAPDHDISFWCDDIEATVAELRARGVEFTTAITDAGFGRLTKFRLPDGTEIQLYEPKYAMG